jgi:hypothetical protein
MCMHACEIGEKENIYREGEREGEGGRRRGKRERGREGERERGREGERERERERERDTHLRSRCY